MEILTGVILCAATAGLTVAAARRWAPRLLPATHADSGEARLRWALVAVLFVVWPVALWGHAGWLGRGALALTAGLLFLASRALPTPARLSLGESPATGPRWPLLLTVGLVAFDLAAFLPASPVDWDAATYHLYFPARWLQEGRIFHIPTVFGDNAAAFAPQNGALFFTWWMALVGRDGLVNVAQLLCLAATGAALYRICRLLGADRRAAALAAWTLPWLAPLRRWTYSANVDVFLLAAWAGALYWLLLYRCRPTAGTAAACGLASGLAMGSKTIGLPLSALVALFLLPRLARRGRLGHLGLYGAGAVLGGGWWYLVGVWRFGNPVFPLAVSLGPWELPGAYGIGAVRAGEFHIEGLARLAAHSLERFGATTWLLIAAGLVALALAAVGGARRRRLSAAGVLCAMAVLWTLYFTFFVPHNDQTRFLLPVLVIGVVGWGLCLAGARRFGRAAMGGLWLMGVAAAALVPRPWRDWGTVLAALSEAGVAGGWLAAFLLATVILAGLALWAHRARWAQLAAAAVVAALAGVALVHADLARAACFARADFRGWAPGYLAFNAPESPPLRLAVTGANVPYALAGIGWRHRVRYVNTRGSPEDGFYDFWRRDPRRHPYHKPGIYRGGDDVGVWLRNLGAEHVDAVVIFALHRAERRYLASTPDGFPVEAAWARARPERFEPVARGPVAEIYRLLPP